MDKKLLLAGAAVGLGFLLTRPHAGAAGSGLTVNPGPNGNPVNHGGWIEVFDPARGWYWTCAPGWTCVGAQPS